MKISIYNSGVEWLSPSGWRDGFMRISRCLGVAMLVIVTMSPLVLRASEFQEPTAEELRMTADPAAPGAAAVYLYYEEIDNDPMHYRSIYARVKVLTDKGKDLATVELPYLRKEYKITDISGRTIHPDGTVARLTVKPEDLMTSKSGQLEIARKVFTLPSVTVGSILEYRYQIHYDDQHFSSPMWQIQGRYYVHKAHYMFIPFENFMPRATEMSGSRILTDSKGREVSSLVWWFHLPKGVTVVQGMNGYSVDVTDVPPDPDEEFMPPIESMLYRVFFYYESAPNAKEYWESAAKEWSKGVDKFAAPSGTIKKAAAEIVRAGDSDEVKAQKLYTAVQALDNTDYTRARSLSEMKALKIKVEKSAGDVWKQKSGSSNDIALLYLALARAAGLKAFAVKVVDRNVALFDPSFMSTAQLSDTLVLVGIDGKGLLLDPGEKMCTFGQVSWRHSDAGGLRQGPKGPGFLTTPGQSYSANLLTRSGEVTLDAQGGMTSYFTFTMRGQEALNWRQRALEISPDELKKAFEKWMRPMMPQGVEAHVDHFLGLRDPNVYLMAVVKAKGTLGTALPHRLLLPGQFFESRGDEPFVQEKTRVTPVDMQYAEEVSDNVVYHFPAGFTVEGAPKGVTEMWKGHAEYTVTTQAGAEQITVGRLLARAFDLAKADEYQALRGFYQKAAVADKSMLVLSAAPAGKTN
jgi:hypothetical protein